VPRLDKNIKALEELWRYMYDNIIYCEVNFRDGYCYSCGYKGDMNIGDDLVRTCPECGENNRENLSVVARTTGYLGSKFWGEARTKEIRERFLHLK
jgi:ribonucleoside-triphosphate reductase